MGLRRVTHKGRWVVADSGLFFILCLLQAGCRATASPDEMEHAAAARSPITGQAAPDFVLEDETGQAVRLTDYRGRWVVLYFYPQDDTPACTCQATEFTDLLSRFRELDAAVLGVSPDTPDSHHHFRQKYGLKLTLLSDTDHRVARAYGAWHSFGSQEQTVGWIIRSTLLIDPAGTITWHWPEVIAKGHAERVRKQLEQLQSRYNS